MATGDVPGFLRNTGDSEEEKEIMSALSNEEITPDNDPAKPTGGEGQPTTPKDGEQQPKPGEGEPQPGGEGGGSQPVQTPEQITEANKVKTDELTKKETDGTITEEEKAELAKLKEAVANPQKPIKEGEPAKPGEKVNQQYKGMENAVDAAKRRAEEKERIQAERTAEDKKREETLSQLRNTPLIMPKVPNPDSYWIGEGDEKTFDMKNYMLDYTKEITRAVQQSLLGGPLAAGVFDLLLQSLKQEHATQSEAASKEEYAITIQTQLETDFPIIKTDTDVREILEGAILREGQRRKAAAEKEGKDFTGLVYEDYKAIALKIVGKVGAKPADQKQDPSEQPKGGPQLNGGQAGPTDEVDKDIEGMMNSKKKDLFEGNF